MSNIFQNRLNKLHEYISIKNYDGMYITNSTNIRYLTGFTGSAGLLLVLDHSAYFFTDGRYIQQSKEQVQNAKITIISNSYFDELKNHNLLSSKMNIGFESEHMSFSYYETMISNFPKINWISTNSIVENLAAIKDDEEIQSLKTAIEITDEVFTKIIPEIKQGVTEKYISTKIKETFQNHNISILFPPKEMMSDNAAMIAWNCLNKNIDSSSDIFFKASPRLAIK